MANSSKRVVIKRVLRAAPEVVFKAITDPEIMARWLYPTEGGSARASSVLEVGGHFQVDMVDLDGTIYVHTGEYREVQPPERLVFTWNSEVVRDTLVTITLKPVEAGTELTLIHDLFPTDALRAQHQEGWGAIVDRLVYTVESSNIP